MGKIYCYLKPQFYKAESNLLFIEVDRNRIYLVNTKLFEARRNYDAGVE